MSLPFDDREQAGKELGAELSKLELERPIVLGVPRGGVAIAAPAAAELGADIDVIVVRKVGAPRNPELGVGAVGAWGEPWLDQRLIAALGVPSVYLEREIEREREEARRRVEAYRGSGSPLDVEGRDVIVVDDGIATGGTVRAALRGVARNRPARLVLAVPVAPPDTLERLRPEVDEVVCLMVPAFLGAIGSFYRDFRQLDDDEVIDLLQQAAQWAHTEAPSEPAAD
jgi:putative phosphoribosyl transferase